MIGMVRKKDISIANTEKSGPGRGDVLIKVMAAGICGTDLHEYKTGLIFIPLARQPITGKKRLSYRAMSFPPFSRQEADRKATMSQRMMKPSLCASESRRISFTSPPWHDL